MASADNCRFPYANPPICNEVIADTFYGYTTFHAIYATIVAIIALISFVQTFRVFKSKGGLFPVDLQRHLHIIMCLLSLAFIIRAIDPLGWEGVVPHRLYVFLTEFCSSLILGATLAVVLSWIKIILKISGSDQTHKKLHRLRRFKHIVQPTFVCIQVFVSQMGIGPGPTWIWNSVLFSFYAFFVFGLVVVGLRYGFLVFQTLRSLRDYDSSPTAKKEAEKATAADFSETSEGDVHSSNHSKDIKLERVPSASASKQKSVKKIEPKKEVGDAGKRIILRRLGALFTMMIIISIVCMVLWCLQILTLVQTQVDEQTKPKNKPTSILNACEYEIIQAVAVLVGLFFFRAVRSKPSENPSEVAASPRKPKTAISPSPTVV